MASNQLKAKLLKKKLPEFRHRAYFSNMFTAHVFYRSLKEHGVPTIGLTTQGLRGVGVKVMW